MILGSFISQKSISNIKERETGRGRTRDGFEALTASLCRHRFGGEVKYMQRMGILDSLAISVQ